MLLKKEQVNTSSYQILFQTYSPKVYRIAFYFMKNEHDAKDVVQEAFMKAFKNMHSLKDKHKFEAWVCTIASNTAKSKLSKRKKEVLVDDEDKVIPFTNIIDMDSVESSVETKELHNHILEVVNSLADHYRLVIILYYYLELSYEEISVFLDISLRTVGSRLYRAKAIIKSKISPEYLELKEGESYEV